MCNDVELTNFLVTETKLYVLLYFAGSCQRPAWTCQVLVTVLGWTDLPFSSELENWHCLTGRVFGQTLIALLDPPSHFSPNAASSIFPVSLFLYQHPLLMACILFYLYRLLSVIESLMIPCFLKLLFLCQLVRYFFLCDSKKFYRFWNFSCLFLWEYRYIYTYIPRCLSAVLILLVDCLEFPYFFFILLEKKSHSGLYLFSFFLEKLY